MAKVITTRVRYAADAVKGSRFVGTASPASSEDHARSLLAEVAAEWPDASHHCWAWRLARPAIERAGDDGEPSGSAGRPMLAALIGRDLVDTAVIVSRWFGGTKLGVGGLVRAYGSTAASTLDAASAVDWVELVQIEVRHQLGDNSLVERVLAGLASVQVLDVEWSTSVHRRLELPADRVDQLWSALADATSGRVRKPSNPRTG